MSARGKTFHLNLKGEYFDQIKAGTKAEEYRLYNDYWKKRLEGKSFEKIVLKKGYPRNDDLDRIIERPWCGYEIKTINHPHFGDEDVKVFAIKVN